MVIPFTGCVEKEPCSVHWNGLTCLGNILTENITFHFFQKMLMIF